MKIKLSSVLSLIAATGLVGTFAFQFRAGRQSKLSPQHIFINETSDHRADESIQVSILAAHARTGVQNAVVITDRFPAVEFEKVAVKLFAQLNLGRDSKGRAILYLFSPKQKALKIEVGYALEGVLPDTKVHFLELAAKTFTFSDRYHDFWAELINTLNIEIYEKEHAGVTGEGFDFSKWKFTSGGAGVFSQEYSTDLSQLEVESKKMKLREQPEYEASPDLRVTLDRYFQSLKEGIGDETLPLLSWETRIYRQLVPHTTYQLHRNWNMYRKAGLDQIFEEPNVAFVFFKAKQPVLPIILKKENGLWKVNEPMARALFHRFEDSMRVFLKFPLRLHNVQIQNYIDQNIGRALYDKPVVNPLNLPKDRLLKMYFEIFWLDRVHHELRTTPLSQQGDDYLWVGADTNTNLGYFSEQIEVLKVLAQRHPKNGTLKTNLQFYESVYQFRGPNWRRAI